MTITLRWGVLGAGNISSQFAGDLVLNNTTPNHEINHVIESIGCSSKDKGEAFVAKLEISKNNNCGVEPVIEPYDNFFKNSNIDIVYVGTIHPLHKEHVTAALENDKHVLCEKPMTMNSKDTKQLIDLAIKKKKYLIEGVWTRFFPAIGALRKYIFEEKVIGEVSRLFADFSYNAHFENMPLSTRSRNINLGAGSLLDIGIYSVTYARLLLDSKAAPHQTNFKLKSLMTIDPEDGVDHSSSVLIRYDNGKQGILTCSEYVQGPQPFLRLEGAKGHVEMHGANPARAVKFRIIFDDGSKSIDYEDSSDFTGFIYEADAIARDIDSGKLQSSIMPHAETLLVADMLDSIRQENGLVYPQDN
ncbi:uncharacterized protein PRCAT00005941001 [Priceomyces carsonii]|uniref:uncharacterized protein n=1 Tax=Priceomyces carsonii TaxID=28549 RepID=UPI002EDA7267|nr:unnamed protein product [Priceomyces carsonii]